MLKVLQRFSMFLTHKQYKISKTYNYTKNFYTSLYLKSVLVLCACQNYADLLGILVHILWLVPDLIHRTSRPFKVVSQCVVLQHWLINWVFVWTGAEIQFVWPKRVPPDRLHQAINADFCLSHNVCLPKQTGFSK